MGLWQNLVAGYDENREQLSNVAHGGLYPLSSTTISNNKTAEYSFLVIVTLDKQGRFIRAEKVESSNPKRNIPLRYFPIPVTQESLSRTSGIAPHPLFDQRAYVFPSLNGGKQNDKNAEYKKLLCEFAESSFAPQSVKAVWNYVSDNRRNFDNDLPDNVKPKTPILFRVEIPGRANSDLWTDPELFSGWHAFYSQKIARDSLDAIDFITGNKEAVAQAHPPKIFLSAGKAKLVSANDQKNFTFRGIYRHPENVAKNERAQFRSMFGLSDAVTIGYESSQKAHQYLRYLIASQGISCGDQVIVPFSIGTTGKRLPSLQVQNADDGWDEDETETAADMVLMLGARTGKGGYAASIRRALQGYELDRQWKAHARSAIVILEAATTGRLSITFYREFGSAEYMERIAQWHEDCKWPLWRKTGDRPVLYFGAPSIDKIIQAAFGWPKPGQDKAYEKIRMRARQNLIRTILDNVPIPRDYLENAILRVSNPLAITDSNGKFDRNRFNSALATTCAILKHNHTKDSFDMSIDLKRTDRDYLYGRLLGAADKLEQYALRKKDNDRLVTAAIRHMQTFSQRPFSAWQIIHNSLLPYIQQVRGSFADRELQAIHDRFNTEAFENDLPLSGLYLVGYYHERAYIDELIRDAHEKSSNNNQTKEN